MSNIYVNNICLTVFIHIHFIVFHKSIGRSTGGAQAQPQQGHVHVAAPVARGILAGEPQVEG